MARDAAVAPPGSARRIFREGASRALAAAVRATEGNRPWLAILLVVLLVPWAARPALAGPWPDLSRPAAVQGGGENDAAVIVGIERYASVPPVPGAVENARQWYLYLTETRSTPPEKVQLLRDNQGTLEKIRKAVGIAAGQVAAGGTLWIIFIGHGAPAADGQDGVLVGFDAQQDPDGLYARSIARREVASLARAAAESRTIMVLDACFSGRTLDGGLLVPGLQPLIPVDSRPVGDPARTLVFTAGTSSEFAGPLTGEARPAFSYLLLGALRGWADQNADSDVSAGEAVAYARKALVATVRDRSQTPDLTGDGTVVIARGAREGAPSLQAVLMASPAPAAKPVQESREEGTTPPADTMGLVLGLGGIYLREFTDGDGPEWLFGAELGVRIPVSRWDWRFQAAVTRWYNNSSKVNPRSGAWSTALGASVRALYWATRSFGAGVRAGLGPHWATHLDLDAPSSGPDSPRKTELSLFLQGTASLVWRPARWFNFGFDVGLMANTGTVQQSMEPTALVWIAIAP